MMRLFEIVFRYPKSGLTIKFHTRVGHLHRSWEEDVPCLWAIPPLFKDRLTITFLTPIFQVFTISISRIYDEKKRRRTWRKNFATFVLIMKLYSNYTRNKFNCLLLFASVNWKKPFSTLFDTLRHLSVEWKKTFLYMSINAIAFYQCLVQKMETILMHQYWEWYYLKIFATFCW